MKLVRGLHNLRPHHRGCVLTIGNYDGLHLGHQAMLRQVRARAYEFGLPACVLSFEPSPREYLASIGAVSPAPGRLSRFREKFQNLEAFQVDRFVCIKFDERIRTISPDEFVSNILVERLGVRWVTIGHDFRFARGREGNARLLRELGGRYGFEVDEMQPFLLDGERVSSSLVREALVGGDMPRATRLLGRPYRISGKVVRGQQLGRNLGFPTANLRLQRRVIPMMGIFAIRVSGAGLHNALGVASLGTRPVVNGIEPLLEAHVFDYSGDLYGKLLHVDFVARLRDELWFPNLDALVVQMKQDALDAREVLARTPIVESPVVAVNATA